MTGIPAKIGPKTGKQVNAQDSSDASQVYRDIEVLVPPEKLPILETSTQPCSANNFEDF
jgi:hypothetical protein